MQDLSEILGGAPAPVETPATVETPEPVQEAPVEAAPEPAPEPTTTVEKAEQPRNEQGRWVRQEPEEKPHAVPVSALIEERRKRQELEARLKELDKPKPEITDDQFWQSPSQAAKGLVSNEVEGLRQEIAGMRYSLAEEMTRSFHADYDSVRDGFIARVQSGDPWAVAIAQQMPLQPNPAKFVYDQAKKLQALDTVGDLSGFEARIRAEERARVLKELQKPAPAPEVPASLNSEPSASVPSSSGDFAQTPLDNLFDRPF